MHLRGRVSNVIEQAIGIPISGLLQRTASDRDAALTSTRSRVDDSSLMMRIRMLCGPGIHLGRSSRVLTESTICSTRSVLLTHASSERVYTWSRETVASQSDVIVTTFQSHAGSGILHLIGSRCRARMYHPFPWGPYPTERAGTAGFGGNSTEEQLKWQA